MIIGGIALAVAVSLLAYLVVHVLGPSEFLREFLSALRCMLAPVVGERAAGAVCGPQAAKKPSPVSVRELETSSFEAYTHCGGCGKLDYHPMREPRAELTDIEFRLARQLDYCLQFSTPEGRRGVAAWKEHTFDVIRTCDCGHEWGQH